MRRSHCRTEHPLSSPPPRRSPRRDGGPYGAAAPRVHGAHPALRGAHRTQGRDEVRHHRRPLHPARREPTHRVPAILTTNGFGGSKDDQAGLGKAFASRGYEVLSYSGLGFGGSGCKITLDDPRWDGKAGSQLVSFLGGAPGIAFTDAEHTHKVAPLQVVRHDRRDHRGAARPHDPRVGMIGGSYGGGNPVRGRQGRPAPGHDRPVHHLERPRLLPRPEQHRPDPRGHHVQPGHHQAHLGPALLGGRRGRRAVRRPAGSVPPLRLPQLPDVRVRGPRDGRVDGLLPAGRPRPVPARVGRALHASASASRRCCSRARTTPCST